MSRAPIQRTREGDFRLRLSHEERELLRTLLAELRALLDGDTSEPMLRRLFPPGYEDDVEEESEYQRLMHGELLAGRREALRVLEATLGRERLREEELHAWLGALNDLRLVLGERLEVTEDVYERELDPHDPEAFELAVYAYLSWLLEQVVEAAATTLPGE
jgi:Domain of unknown function (DUF2017)